MIIKAIENDTKKISEDPQDQFNISYKWFFGVQQFNECFDDLDFTQSSEKSVLCDYLFVANIIKYYI